MKASSACVLILQLSTLLHCDGFLTPTKTTGHKILPITHRRANDNHARQRSRISMSSPDEIRRYPTEEMVNEILSGGLTKGQPSYPAWKSKIRRNQLYEMTDWATSDAPNRPILCEYEPDAMWLWSRWRGTVLSLTYMSIAANVALGILVNWYVVSHTDAHWSLLAVPPADDPLIQELTGMKTLWEYQLTLVTFILAFFTSQAYSYWRQVYFTTRAIQGRINDICLIVTTNAERESSTPIDGRAMSDYTERAAALVETCTRLIRVSHTFFWATIPTNSNGVSDKEWVGKTLRVNTRSRVDEDEDDDESSNAIGPILLSRSGLRYLERANELTHAEVQTLLQSDLPPSQYTYMLMQWVAIYAMEGFADGTLVGGDGAERELIRRVTDLRAEYFSIGDLSAGRMPIAYVQLLQILVDTLVWLAPLSLYPGLGVLSIPLCAILTHFFKGLLELSKSFLDPFGNDGYPNQNIRVDVLVSELNFGTASRWREAARRVPAPSRPSPKAKIANETNRKGLNNSDVDGQSNFHPL